ncbi:ATP-dependent acyl-CoA ligase [Pseudonocardia halophobica]|uniref:ATP-dependent acyl-CoA ligase n=1 Tax=Pseudonocardia halophobica TaxID=29401 RepID=A0A9W6KXE6_9PSEU|nr:ATP-dependent acyl-CoA ligase [Pseudonocardia halophobica]
MVLQDLPTADGGASRSWTAAETQAETRRRAGAFASIGVGPGTPVATMPSTSADSVLTWFGLASLGAYEIPVSPELTRDLLVTALSNAGAEALVVEQAGLSRALDLAAALPLLRTVIVSGDGPLPPDSRVRRLSDLAGPELDRPLPNAGDVACGMLTSGTTGPPKCLLVPWGQLRQMFAAGLGIERDSPDEVMFVFTPFNHLIARGLVYRALLFDGGRAVLRPRFSRSMWWSDIKAAGCTEAIMPAAAAYWLLAADPGPADADNPLRRVVITPLIDEAREFADRFGVQVSVAFSATECGMAVASDGLPPDLRSCGRAVPGTELRILDVVTGAPVPDGAIGQLHVRNAPTAMCVGRLGGPPVPRDPDGWVATGDLFHRDTEGWYFFDGRMHDVIRRRGENISPHPIENAATAQPDILLAAAVAVPSAFGEDDIKLYVQPTPSAQLDLDDLAGRLEDALPRFMVPRYLEARAELPMTPTGKIRRAELRAEPTVTDSTVDRDRRLSPPRGAG